MMSECILVYTNNAQPVCEMASAGVVKFESAEMAREWQVAMDCVESTRVIRLVELPRSVARKLRVKIRTKEVERIFKGRYIR